MGMGRNKGAERKALVPKFRILEPGTWKLPTETCFLSRRYRTFLQNLLYGSDGGLQFLICVVEMWRETNAGFRPPIDQNVATEKVAADFLRIRHVDGHGAAALFGIARRIHAPTVPVG